MEIEQDEPTHDRWSGEFSSRYIEDITAKTGNFKKFPVFVRMLQTALASSSSSVFVDLLTFSDLQMLRARKLSQNKTENDRAGVVSDLMKHNAKAERLANEMELETRA